MKHKHNNSPLARLLFGPVNEKQLQRHRADVQEKLAQINLNHFR